MLKKNATKTNLKAYTAYISCIDTHNDKDYENEVYKMISHLFPQPLRETSTNTKCLLVTRVRYTESISTSIMSITVLPLQDMRMKNSKSSKDLNLLRTRFQVKESIL